MPKAKIKNKRRAPAPEAPPHRSKTWLYGLLFAAAFAAALFAYEPALAGPFVFDDLYLPFTGQEYANAPLRVWMTNVRPLLMLSFWANYKFSGMQPFSYHFVNLLLHVLTSGLAFLIARRLLERAGEKGFARDATAAFAGGLFLLHPLQTESVAYVASRSELLSVFFFYGAFALFLYRRKDAISWVESVGVLLLFAAAANTKEHTAVLPLLLLLTDYYWNPGFSLRGIRRNWRVYGLIAIAGAFALRMVWGIIRHADTAGFSMKEFTWYQYFYTQCRVIWLYIRMFFLPYGLNVDHDFPISFTVMQHGAVFALAALMAAAAAALYYRKRFPLASYGFFVFLLLLAPTSSIVPIADPVAERRMYLPMIGLLLVVAEFLRRWKVSRGVVAALIAGVLVFAAFTTYARSLVWSSDLALWHDSASKSPLKSRPQFQLAFALFAQGRCAESLPHYAAAAVRAPSDYRLFIDWAVALDCAGRGEEALEKLRKAMTIQNSAQVHALFGDLYRKHGKRDDALRELSEAERIDPNFELTYLYRGALYHQEGDIKSAANEYRRALSLNPASEAARQGLASLQSR
ncbi:MAG: tetratricopeptide repeat protein [Acidobacteriota bacterium]